MTKRNTLIALFTATMLALPVGMAMAGEGFHHGPEIHRKLIKQLDLTEEQKAQAKALREKNFDANRADRLALHGLMQEFRALERAGANTAELKAKADVIAAKMSETMVERAVHMREFRAILTAEQQVKLDQLVAEREQKREERMQARHEKMMARGKSSGE